uniref:Dynein light chain n=2 Tax=Hemiselmis TaxID=77924 RepID=A0A6T8P543_HEMAN|mmetsp:Transcript_40136/g.93983  ORF Transcript_40136/g.93983 Transcript_40136/m.93983 type:complete len:116 (+) Transcript_40136:94-441(+)|eukprot:CAMPEP_0174915404 /NCGR_PEP_ID=MMETSP1355-20121228/1040_1 /TAXON_ID=464990 /ORGANISM="Hemiselmis tepida, Strain CCMP443" /LENGTH=115 /DNA_ID=CAMNT_0016160283 /DNA_START=93 /DNA_END=440 /DNA_ORIENTATION=-
MADPSAVIKNAQTAADARQAMMYALVRPQTDMKEEMRMEATDTVVSAIEKFGNMKPPKYDLAAKQVKEAMDKKYAPNWCCVIGETFGADIVCEKQTLLYMFYAGNLAVLLFKNPF